MEETQHASPGGPLLWCGQPSDGAPVPLTHSGLLAGQKRTGGPRCVLGAITAAASPGCPVNKCLCFMQHLCFF